MTRIGVSLSSSHQVDGPANMVERARAAHRAGFDSLSVGDHHNMAIPYVQNTPILGRLLAEWTGRPAGCLFLVPLWHPLLMAEQIGTLAAIHDDRFIVQTGLGWGKDQFAAFGTTERNRARAIDAAVPLVRSLLAGETVDSEMFGIVGGRVGLRPDAPVEWWIGGGATASLRRAADLGDVWYAGPGLGVENGRLMLDQFREMGGDRAAIRKDALVLADGDRARTLAAELIDGGYRGLGLGELIVGDADDAAEQLAAYGHAGFEEVVIRCMSVPQDLAIETLELIGSIGEQVRGP